VVAAERLRELSGLLVADAASNLADGERRVRGEQLRRPRHAQAAQRRPVGGAVDLLERPLELAARGGDARRHLVQLDLGRVLDLEDPQRVVQQLLASLVCPFAVRHLP
jgi:hypothetical protein